MDPLINPWCYVSAEFMRFKMEPGGKVRKKRDDAGEDSTDWKEHENMESSLKGDSFKRRRRIIRRARWLWTLIEKKSILSSTFYKKEKQGQLQLFLQTWLSSLTRNFILAQSMCCLPLRIAIYIPQDTSLFKILCLLRKLINSFMCARIILVFLPGSYQIARVVSPS